MTRKDRKRLSRELAAARRAARAPAPAPDPVARIAALTQNARNTWFALLGVLVFVGVTLMGVEHIDFYGVNRATQLPLVNVSVPTDRFFYAAPILTAAIYGYFHLYLIRLWDALGAAPARIDGQPLGDTVPPWLITDAALHLRLNLRPTEPPCTQPRTMDLPAAALNLLLAWFFGLIVLGLLWWLSMPARTLEMTAIAGASLLAALATGTASLTLLIHRMKTGAGPTLNLWSTAPAMAAMLLSLLILPYLTWARTGGVERLLAPIDLAGEQVVIRPDGWLPYDIAWKDFLGVWCKREEVPDCKDRTANEKSGFDEEWSIRRTATLAALAKPDRNPLRSDDLPGDEQGREAKRSKAPDLRNANLRGAFLSGLNLTMARLQGADLVFADLEGADLRHAWMEEANLWGARMEEAELYLAHIEDAVFSFAYMERADFRRARMASANLSGAWLESARFGEAQMQGVKLLEARLERADLSYSQMERADLSFAWMEETNFEGASLVQVDLFKTRMQGANLSYSTLAGVPQSPNPLQSTNLSASTNNGGALRFMDLRDIEFDAATDFRNAFLDASVSLPDGFRIQMGNPCQWAGVFDHNEPLTDEEFNARWRGWVEAGPEWSIWGLIAPAAYRDIEPIPPDPGCEWKTGPMPGAE